MFTWGGNKDECGMCISKMRMKSRGSCVFDTVL